MISGRWYRKNFVPQVHKIYDAKSRKFCCSKEKTSSGKRLFKQYFDELVKFCWKTEVQCQDWFLFIMINMGTKKICEWIFFYFLVQESIWKYEQFQITASYTSNRLSYQVLLPDNYFISLQVLIQEITVKPVYKGHWNYEEKV